eukprot:COSAG04_NODE_7246_length_1160_cov_2.032045_1_plen_143_part_00
MKAQQQQHNYPVLHYGLYILQYLQFSLSLFTPATTAPPAPCLLQQPARKPFTPAANRTDGRSSVVDAVLELGGRTDDLIGMHKIPLAKIKSLRGTGEDFVWEADVQLRQNREMEKENPPQTTERYKPAVAVDEAGNEIAAAV